MKTDFGVNKRVRAGLKDRIDGVDQGGFRTIIGAQRKAIGDVSGGIHVSKHIGTAKTVDGLLGIADEKQAAAGIGKQLAKNVVLDRVGVLEFVDQGRLVTAADRCRQRRPAGLLQRLPQLQQQVIEMLDVLPAFANRKFRLERPEKLRLEKQEVRIQGRNQLLFTFGNRVAEIEHRMNRRDLFDSSGISEFGGREQFELLGKRKGIAPGRRTEGTASPLPMRVSILSSRAVLASPLLPGLRAP